jgi:hypothetical protein
VGYIYRPRFIRRRWSLLCRALTAEADDRRAENSSAEKIRYIFSLVNTASLVPIISAMNEVDQAYSVIEHFMHGFKIRLCFQWIWQNRGLLSLRQPY